MIDVRNIPDDPFARPALSTELTRKQRAIYEFIADCVQHQGIPPSLTEIAEQFELASASGVADHLRALERKGYIRRRRGVSRGIEISDASRRASTPPRTVQVPVIGSLPARKPLHGKRNGGRHLMFDGRVAQQGAVAVRVNLEGLEGRGILRGDYLIVIRGAAPRAGELGLAQLRRSTVLIEMLPGRRGVRRVDDDAELDDGFEMFGRVVAVLRSMNETKETTERDR
jgi:repressor LexA